MLQQINTEPPTLDKVVTAKSTDSKPLQVQPTKKSIDQTTKIPTVKLTKEPTKNPTEAPSQELTQEPTQIPTQETQACKVSSLTESLHVPQIVLSRTYTNHPAKILIDCGATGDFISHKFAKIQKLPTTSRTPLAITLADGRTQESCTTQTKSFCLQIGFYSTHLQLDLTTLNDDYDIILGMPWLQHVNPMIDWVN